MVKISKILAKSDFQTNNISKDMKSNDQIQQSFLATFNRGKVLSLLHRPHTLFGTTQ